MYSYRHKPPGQSKSGYATFSRFCGVLIADSRALYLLAFVLTGCHADAERCFLATVGDVVRPNSVFEGWERSWTKRCLIINAIRLVFSAPARISRKPDSWSTVDFDSRACYAVNALTRLSPPLQRFVFVMSVLERYSLRECALLLGQTPREVARARVDALRQLPWLEPALMQSAVRNGTYDR